MAVMATWGEPIHAARGPSPLRSRFPVSMIATVSATCRSIRCNNSKTSCHLAPCLMVSCKGSCSISAVSTGIGKIQRTMGSPSRSALSGAIHSCVIASWSNSASASIARKEIPYVLISAAIAWASSAALCLFAMSRSRRIRAIPSSTASPGSTWCGNEPLPCVQGRRRARSLCSPIQATAADECRPREMNVHYCCSGVTSHTCSTSAEDKGDCATGVVPSLCVRPS